MVSLFEIYHYKLTEEINPNDVLKSLKYNESNILCLSTVEFGIAVLFTVVEV